MPRALHVALLLSQALLGILLLLLVGGLAMVARPELFAGLRLADAARTGLELALVAGAGAIFCAVLGRILSLVRGEDQVGHGD